MRKERGLFPRKSRKGKQEEYPPLKKAPEGLSSIFRGTKRCIRIGESRAEPRGDGRSYSLHRKKSEIKEGLGGQGPRKRLGFLLQGMIENC